MKPTNRILATSMIAIAFLAGSPILGAAKPGRLQHAGLSCGAGHCVVANGINGITEVKEAWIYTDESESWSKVNCKRYLCPSARQMTGMAWVDDRLLITGGYVDLYDTPNEDFWSFTFEEDGPAGTWSYDPDWDPSLDCTGAGVVHPGARMAYDQPSGKLVFFGGEENAGGLVRYADTAVCN